MKFDKEARARMTLRLHPLGDQDAATLEWLAGQLPASFHSARMEIVERRSGDLKLGFNRRKQYSAEALLNAFAVPGAGSRVLGVVDADLYLPEINHVFGLAQPWKRRAIIQLPRLRESFYGRPQDQGMFLSRVLTEAVHELGHTFGLAHCSNPGCAMYRSSRLEDIDGKSPYLCTACKPADLV